jgi:hypothetical protein
LASRRGWGSRDFWAKQSRESTKKFWRLRIILGLGLRSEIFYFFFTSDLIVIHVAESQGKLKILELRQKPRELKAIKSKQQGEARELHAEESKLG